MLHVENKNVPALRFSEFKEPWKEEIFSNYILEHRGGASLNPNAFTEASDFEVVPKKAVVKGSLLQLSEASPTYCLEDFFINNKNAVVDSSYLITTLRDLVPTAPSIGLIVRNLSEKKLLLAQGVYGFKVREGLVPYFLTNLSNKESYRRLMYRICVGSTQVHVRSSEFFKIKMILPEVEEQQKIGDFLSAVDRKINLLKQKHSLLHQYKKGVMQQLFSQKVRFKDDDGNDFPDWLEKTMADVLGQEIREIPKPDENYLAIGVRSHMKGTFQKPNFDPDAIMMEKLYVVSERDLIVNITFAWEGAIAIVKKEDEGGLVSHRFPTYVFKSDQTTHEYFKHIIQEKRFKYMLDLISPGGAGRNRVLSKKEFLKLKWDFPCVQEQKKIASFLGALDRKIDLAAQQIELTQTFKKGLLQQMFV